MQAPPSDQQDIEGLMERLLGRKPTAAETRFFIDFATVAVGSGSSGPTVTHGNGTLIASSDARTTATLAPRSLGVPTRNISEVARPLPRGRLPGGIARASHPRLYRVRFDLLRRVGVDRAGRHTIYVYLTRRGRLGVWEIAWVGPKP